MIQRRKRPTAVKSKWIGVRVDEEYLKEFYDYLDRLEEQKGEPVEVGRTIRQAIREYMWAHPITEEETQ